MHGPVVDDAPGIARRVPYSHGHAQAGQRGLAIPGTAVACGLAVAGFRARDQVGQRDRDAGVDVDEQQLFLDPKRPHSCLRHGVDPHGLTDHCPRSGRL